MKVVLLSLLLVGTPGTAEDVATALAARLEETYVDQAAATAIAAELRRRTSAGAFDRLAGDDLAKALNGVIRTVTADPHLGIRHTTDPITEPGGSGPSADASERLRQIAAAQNFGFEKVERLAGNIGFMELNGFVDPAIGGDTAVAAMAFLANTDALIVDLRYNSGGVPGIGQLISSYLFDTARHLHSIEWREPPASRVQQFWTLPVVPGRRLTTQPAFHPHERSHDLRGREFRLQPPGCWPRDHRR